MHVYLSHRDDRKIGLFTALISLVLSSILAPTINEKVQIWFSDLGNLSWLQHVWSGVSLLTFFLIIQFLFENFLWKIPLTQKMIGVKNFSGVWTGLLESSSKDLGQELPIVMSIHQTATTVSIKLRSAQSESVSDSAYMEVDPDGDGELRYMYKNSPLKTEGETFNPHTGFARLNLLDPNKLSGTYFTDGFRKNHGHLNFQRYDGTFREAVSELGL